MTMLKKKRKRLETYASRQADKYQDHQKNAKKYKNELFLEATKLILAAAAAGKA